MDLSAIDLSDADHGGSDLTVTLTTSTGGNLSATTGGGVTVAGSGSNTLTLTGSQGDLNTYLNTASNVQYLHSTINTFGDDADTVNVVVNDGGNTGSDGGIDQNLGTTNVDITGVNDEQVLSTNVGDTVAEGSTGNTITNLLLQHNWMSTTQTRSWSIPSI